MIFKLLITIAAVALAANAQTTTTTGANSIPSGISTCIVNCSAEAAPLAGCSSYSDRNCVCTSTVYQNAQVACLQANCTAEDVTAAAQIQAEECASVSSGSTGETTSVTGTSPASITATSSSASHTSSTSGSSNSSSTSVASSAAASSAAATGVIHSIALNGAFGGLVALAGTLIGAALVL